MYWYVWWIVSAAILAFTLIDAFVLSKLRYKRKRVLTPNKMLILGTFVSAMILFCPIYLEKFSDSVFWVEWIKAILLSMQHAIRLFAFEGNYVEFFGGGEIHALPRVLQMLYTGTGAFLYAFAPLLTFGILLSFFKNASAYRKYLFSFHKHTHVFSCLNEKSLALAKSIDDTCNRKGDGRRRHYRIFRKAQIVFTDVSGNEDGENGDLIEEAKEMGAILFSKDLTSVKYRRKGYSPRKLSFYLISEDKEETLRHAESIMHDYDLPSVEMRVFSDDVRSELLLAAKNLSDMKAIRINDVQSLIYHNLDMHGLRFFRNARDEGGGEKVISTVVVGLGKYGFELTKALAWFCQMDGYRLRINVFDMDEHAEDRFEGLCPELMDKKLNGEEVDGEARYEIRIHGGIDTKSTAFFEKLAAITDATYIFVCLGNDRDNLDTAVRIRSLTERVTYTGDGHKPDVETVIYDSDISASMGVKWEADTATEYREGVANFKKQYYNIHMIGDLSHLYSVETLLNSRMVQKAETANKEYAEKVYTAALEKIRSLTEETMPKYSEEKTRIEREREENIRAFYRYEYNYRSSIARIIHAEKSETLQLKSAETEHKRWNAYMRAEGYRYSGSNDEDTRNDLAKLHHNLVAFQRLDDKKDVPKDA